MITQNIWYISKTNWMFLTDQFLSNPNPEIILSLSKFSPIYKTAWSSNSIFCKVFPLFKKPKSSQKQNQSISQFDHFFKSFFTETNEFCRMLYEHHHMLSPFLDCDGTNSVTKRRIFNFAISEEKNW